MLLEPAIETLDFRAIISRNSGLRRLSSKNFRLSHNGHHGLEHWLLLMGDYWQKKMELTFRLLNILHLFTI